MVRMRILSAALFAAAAVGCSTGDSQNDETNTLANPVPAHLTAPAGQGELWACKFSVDPVTKLPNGDITTAAISASITTGDGTLESGVSGGNTTTIGYNAPGVPQCTKIWSGGTGATVAVTEAPGAGSAFYFYRLARRTPGAQSDDVYYESPVANPPSTTPVTASVQVTSGAAYEIWFKNVKATTPPPPENGCTYTQGYWKTHSASGPAPYDDGWKNLGPLEEKTLFFNVGQTWLTVWNTPPRGNAFYQLAHQYMAAKLNVLNGASSPTDVANAISGAEALFNSLAAGSNTLTDAQKSQAQSWATLLDNYNNGLVGPGHCD